MYDLAEKCYPYTNLRAEVPVNSSNESKERRENVKYSVNRPESLFVEGSAPSFVFVYMMSRPGAKGIFDMSQIFVRPARAMGWLFLGNSILFSTRMSILAQQHDSPHQYALNLRVSQNE